MLRFTCVLGLLLATSAIRPIVRARRQARSLAATSTEGPVMTAPATTTTSTTTTTTTTTTTGAPATVTAAATTGEPAIVTAAASTGSPTSATLTTRPPTLVPHTCWPPMPRKQKCPKGWRNLEKCPKGWTYDVTTQRCYKMYPKAADWRQARLLCSECRGELVSIPSAHVNNLVKTMAQDSAVWIGMTDLDFKTGFWHWTDGNKRVYKNWAALQPTSGFKDHNCAAMQPAGDWGNRNCSKPLPYVCSRTITKARPMCLWGSFVKKCPPGWKYFPRTRRCYMKNHEKLTWEDASKQCRHLGGDLVSFHSGAEQRWVSKHIVNNASKGVAGQDHTWIGLNDHNKMGEYEWSDSSKFDFKLWSDHDFRKYKTIFAQPNNGDHLCGIPPPAKNPNREQCIVMRYDAEWYDTRCVYKYPSICSRCPDVDQCTLYPSLCAPGGSKLEVSEASLLQELDTLFEGI